MEIQFLKSGNKIHIKKLNLGKFTDYCGGKVTQECINKGKHSSNSKIRKRATFADNARKWHKYQLGGFLHKVTNFIGSDDGKTILNGVGQSIGNALNASTSQLQVLNNTKSIKQELDRLEKQLYLNNLALILQNALNNNAFNFSNNLDTSNLHMGLPNIPLYDPNLDKEQLYLQQYLENLRLQELLANRDLQLTSILGLAGTLRQEAANKVLKDKEKELAEYLAKIELNKKALNTFKESGIALQDTTLIKNNIMNGIFKSPEIKLRKGGNIYGFSI